MSNVIFLDFRNGLRLPAPEVNTTPSIDVSPADLVSRIFTKYDQTLNNIRARFGEHQPEQGTVYHQSITQKRGFDTYGFGCLHNSIHQYRPKPGEIWNKPCPFPADIRAIEKFLKKRPKTLIRVGVKSDAFMYMDQKYNITKSVLELANHYGVKLVFHTMSDLCAHDDYLPLIKAGGHKIVMQLGFEDERLERLASPGGPSMDRRLKAIDKLRKAGVTVETREPVIPDEKTQVKLFGEVVFKKTGVK